MDKELFDDLVASIKDAGAYLRGEKDAPVYFVDEPNPKIVRERLGLTQEAFARLLCVSVKTLQNWEQGRREPNGAAMRLLQVADKHPEVLLELVA
jgi:putative transcriptional regulator